MENKSNNEMPYKNPRLNVGERVRDLVGRMTLKEKARQLDQYFGADFMSRTHPYMSTVMADDAEIMWIRSAKPSGI